MDEDALDGGFEATEGADERHILHNWAFAAAIILSLATLLSAWAGYQATRWSSEYSLQTRSATVARIEAVASADTANRQLTTDILLTSDWFQAAYEGNDRLADQIRARFRPEFVPIFDEWLAGAVEGELPPGTPFDQEYQLAADLDAERLQERAAETSLSADDAGTTSDNYVLAAVLFASVLFLAGISSKIPGPRAQHLTVVLSGVAFLVAVVFTLRLPILL